MRREESSKVAIKFLENEIISDVMAAELLRTLQDD
jgi:hypothetical protein